MAYSAAEVSELTGLSTDRIYELCRRGKLPHVRVGERQILIPRRKLERWLEGGDGQTAAIESHAVRH
jgi:excisionase family DNA binding protein